MVIFRVSVQLEHTDLLHRELGPWPDFGHIEWVEADLGGFFRSHDLYFQHPLEGATFGDGLVELSLGVVRVETLSSEGLVKVELLGLELRDPVVLKRVSIYCKLDDHTIQG